MSTEVAPVDMSYRDVVLYPVLDIAAFIHEHGKEGTIQVMQKPGVLTSEYTEGKQFWVMAMDYEGTILASSRHPENAVHVRAVYRYPPQFNWERAGYSGEKRGRYGIYEPV
ncbi:MAG: hypothetical protein MJ014_05095 [Methanocorpusculum sp.]|nr:hypothetical protein [Methanocorpusculum sp.]